MPEICRFYGIIIRMYFGDHAPPHIHVEYGSDQALIDIQTLAIFAGRLQPRAMGLVVEWASLHQQELMDFWNQAVNMQPLGRIEPLK
jgi:hypothetical protein